MQQCDVLIVGGGPAGSVCAWALGRAGLDVVIVDAATFPRDKVCAGWITPQVVSELGLDVDDYRRGRTCQPITAFRTGIIGSADAIETMYDAPVSYGIRRCEFDHHLLQRSGACMQLGLPIVSIDRHDSTWVVNDAIRAPLLVGAGGHFCPVARLLNGTLRAPAAPLVVAQEVEFAIDADDPAYAVRPEQPELYFCRDLKGYGWCFRKGRHVNVGIGRLDRQSLPRATVEFVDFLKAGQRVPRDANWKWRGHAYLLHPSPRRVVDDGMLLIGDAAGLAYPESGEGIRPAIESGLMAASTIVEAHGRYARDELHAYAERLRMRFGAPQAGWLASWGTIGHEVATTVARRLLRVPWFVRRVVLDRWFLHAQAQALT